MSINFFGEDDPIRGTVFRVTRQSFDLCSPAMPLSFDSWKLRKKVIVPLFRDEPEEDLAWFVEIDTLETLLTLIKQEGDIEITPPDPENGHPFPELKIRDGESWDFGLR